MDGGRDFGGGTTQGVRGEGYLDAPLDGQTRERRSFTLFLHNRSFVAFRRLFVASLFVATTVTMESLILLFACYAAVHFQAGTTTTGFAGFCGILDLQSCVGEQCRRCSQLDEARHNSSGLF